MIRILIADDHAIVRTGLKQLFDNMPDLEVAAEAANANEVLEHLGRIKLDLLLMDLDMPGTCGVDLILRSKAKCPRLPILVLSMHDEPGIALHAVKAGAAGYINKGCDLGMLFPAIRRVASGGTYIAPSIAEKMLSHDTPPISQGGGFEQLTDREMQVFNLLFNGVSVNDIAAQLGISNKTVSTHKARLMEKLGLSTIVDLIHYAQLHKLQN